MASVFPVRTFLGVQQGKAVIFQGARRKHAHARPSRDDLLAISAPTHACPSVAVDGSACAMGSVCCWKSACSPSPQAGPLCAESELAAEHCGLTEWSRVSLGRRVGRGQTKGLLKGLEYGGLPASKGLVFPQRKIHDFVPSVPEEMSHLHRRAGGVWKHGRA